VTARKEPERRIWHRGCCNMSRWWIGRELLILIWLTCIGAQATAEVLPPIRSGPGNEVPNCMKTAALMAFVRDQSRRVDPPTKSHPRFVRLASVYRRIGRCVQKVEGKCESVRWDFAFFQMLLETNYLTFRAPDGSPGIISPEDNNFAGIGATGVEPAEKFGHMETGVLAHLQHLLMYSGEKISDPVARRTRTVESYVLSRMGNLGRPPTFADLATLWTGTDQDTYGADILGIATSFARLYCSTAGRGHVPKR
jgi:Mannosyl-glycoprotein endo-beta-N-acetylglucosaminidase